MDLFSMNIYKPMNTNGINSSAFRKKFNRAIMLRVSAILLAAILITGSAAGCYSTQSRITETAFQEKAVESTPKTTEGRWNESAAGSTQQTVSMFRPAQSSETTNTSDDTESAADTTTTAKPELQSMNSTTVPEADKPVQTTAKPTETAVKPTETTARPVETTVRPVETTARPAETTAPANLQYVPMTSQEKAVADQLLVLLNNYRKTKGLAPVAAGSGYLKAASIRADEAAVVFQHDRPDGSDFYTVLEDLGLPFVACGENLAGRSGGISDQTAGLLMDQWIQSAGHNDNMLNPDWKYAGIGVCLAADGQTVYAAQFFAAG
jgi:uncharacterized protein YkwD